MENVDQPTAKIVSDACTSIWSEKVFPKDTQFTQEEQSAGLTTRNISTAVECFQSNEKHVEKMAIATGAETFR